MKYRNVALTILVTVLMLGWQSQATAQIFFTDSFDYADGDLTTVSEGSWVGHSGNPPDIQVLDGNAVVTAPGSMDDNRQIGAVMAADDIWYYAVRFTVNMSGDADVNNDYFIHFKDSGTSAFNARLATVAPEDVNRDFSLQIWASSFGDGMANWDGDFDFGEEIIAVVRWNNGTGEATLWVNPVDINSTSITDDELADAMRAVEALALRQDSTAGSIVTIPVVSVGTDFDAVLAEVTPAQGAFVCPTPITNGNNWDCYNVFRGMELSGTCDDFCGSDDVRAIYNPGFVINSEEAPVWLEFEGNAPTAIDVQVESQAGTPGLSYTAEAWNYVTGSYDVLGTAGESFNSDVVTTFALTSADQIDGNGDVQSRIGWRKTGLTINFPWEVRVDQVGWNE